MSNAHDMAKKQKREDALVKKHLGKPSLRHRIKEFALGSHNHKTNESGRGMQKTLAVRKENIKLAKLLEERRKNGERAKTAARRPKKTSAGKKGVNQK